MLLIPSAFLKRIIDHAEAAYPKECCGLLAGRTEGATDLVVTRVEASPNVTETDQTDRFEVDPQVRFDLMRVLEGTNKRIIGHYHSHPDHPAQPSVHDLAQAHEPDLVWLIVSVVNGQAVLPAAHVLDQGGRQFRQIGLRTTDWTPYPKRDLE